MVSPRAIRREITSPSDCAGAGSIDRCRTEWRAPLSRCQASGRASNVRAEPVRGAQERATASRADFACPTSAASRAVSRAWTHARLGSEASDGPAVDAERWSWLSAGRLRATARLVTLGSRNGAAGAHLVRRRDGGSSLPRQCLAFPRQRALGFGDPQWRAARSEPSLTRSDLSRHVSDITAYLVHERVLGERRCTGARLTLRRPEHGQRHQR